MCRDVTSARAGAGGGEEGQFASASNRAGACGGEPGGGVVRRARTVLPPLVTEDPSLQRRLTASGTAAISVKFTSELVDRRGLARWRGR